MNSVTSGPLEETIHHISSTPGSFTLLYSTPNWPIPHIRDDGPPSSSASSSSSDKPDGSRIHISVLDSSFNPPTKAHHQIAFSKFPSPTQPENTSSIASSSSDSSNDEVIVSSEGNTSNPLAYTSRLLLFSARNVEKTLKSSDASVSQRVEMMKILVDSYSVQNPGGGGGEEALAIGLINEPTFVGKSSIIRNFLSTISIPLTNTNTNMTKLDQSKIDLTFLIGTDTLIRFFDPRFYPPNQMSEKIDEYFKSWPGGNGSYLVSARRGQGNMENRAVEDEILNREGIKQYVDSGKLRLLGTGEEGWEEISSTQVREAVSASNWDRVEELVGWGIRDYVQKEGLYSQ